MTINLKRSKIYLTQYISFYFKKYTSLNLKWKNELAKLKPEEQLEFIKNF